MLIVKEVTTRPFLKMGYTWVLDVLVTRGFRMWYWNEAQSADQLERAGYRAEILPINDWLPYPHVLYYCQKRNEG